MLIVLMDCIYNYSINILRYRCLVKVYFFIVIVFYIVLLFVVFDIFIVVVGEFLYNY